MVMQDLWQPHFAIVAQFAAAQNPLFSLKFLEE
jgi:hypothetical protein